MLLNHSSQYSLHWPLCFVTLSCYEIEVRNQGKIEDCTISSINKIVHYCQKCVRNHGLFCIAYVNHKLSELQLNCGL